MVDVRPRADGEVEGDVDPASEAQEIIAEMRRAVVGQQCHWFLALLQAIRRWPLAEEQREERTYRYLIGGEAFDWLLLAERLCDELEGLIPDDERDNLLFHGRLPMAMEDDEFQRQLGAKHRAHLNFVYGVRVEEALQLAVATEVHKDHLSRVWANGHVDDEAFHRIYDAPRLELLKEFRSEQALPDGDHISVTDLKEFTYWLFKRRLRHADPARVASDTRKGLAQLQCLEALRLAPSRTPAPA